MGDQTLVKIASHCQQHRIEDKTIFINITRNIRPVNREPSEQIQRESETTLSYLLVEKLRKNL